MSLTTEVKTILDTIGVDASRYTNGAMPSFSPITGEQIGALNADTPATAADAIAKAKTAFARLA